LKIPLDGDLKTADRKVVTNTGTDPVPGPLWLVPDNLRPGATLLNSEGITGVLAPLGSPYVGVPVGGDEVLHPSESKALILEFDDPSGEPIDYETRLLSVIPVP
jgi:hypothetical protein